MRSLAEGGQSDGGRRGPRRRTVRGWRTQDGRMYIFIKSGNKKTRMRTGCHVFRKTAAATVSAPLLSECALFHRTNDTNDDFFFLAVPR